MRVRIKTEKELLSIGTRFVYRNAIGYKNELLFVNDMFKYCGKMYDVKLIKFAKFTENKKYRIIEEQRINNESWRWNHWMFDIIPEVDSKKNYLLEF